MTRFGVDTSTTELAARSAARQIYHAFLNSAAEWTMPDFIGRAMADWRFADATSALQVATSIRSLAEQVDQTLPGANGVMGDIKMKFEGATSLSDLQAAQRLAQDQLDAAKAVASADAQAAQARGPLESVGLIRTDVAAMSATALHQVSVGNLSDARAEADQITQVAGGAATAGLIRLAGA